MNYFVEFLIVFLIDEINKINYFFSGLFLCYQNSFAQTASELQETARSFMQQGDYANAILVLNRATALEPNNMEIHKDLALELLFSKRL